MLLREVTAMIYDGISLSTWLCLPQGRGPEPRMEFTAVLRPVSYPRTDSPFPRKQNALQVVCKVTVLGAQDDGGRTTREVNLDRGSSDAHSGALSSQIMSNEISDTNTPKTGWENCTGAHEGKE